MRRGAPHNYRRRTSGRLRGHGTYLKYRYNIYIVNFEAIFRLKITFHQTLLLKMWRKIWGIYSPVGPGFALIPSFILFNKDYVTTVVFA